MIFRKVGLGVVIIPLALLLSSCVEVRGDLSVSSAARINGEITYTLKKSSAAGVGLNSLADVKSEASTNPEAQIGFCKDAPITEDSSNYILKCALKDVLTDSGEISASITGGTIVFRYKANLDPSSTTGDQTNFGSVSITIRFLNPVISFKENKVGLVRKVDDLTYQISGSANEPMNIEITANLAASSGSANTAPAPVPSTTANPTDATTAAAELKAKQEADAKAEVELKAKQEADAKAAAELKAKQEADAKAEVELKAKQEADAKAAAELKAKQEADAKAAADLKAKQEADAKAAADLKAKQEAEAAEAKAAADKAAEDLRAKQEAEEKAAAALKAKQDAKATADLNAKQAADSKAAAAKAAAAKILADAKAKAAAAAKKITITCVKGKLTKKVTAIKPVCPKGYKKK